MCMNSRILKILEVPEQETVGHKHGWANQGWLSDFLLLRPHRPQASEGENRQEGEGWPQEGWAHTGSTFLSRAPTSMPVWFFEKK